MAQDDRVAGAARPQRARDRPHDAAEGGRTDRAVPTDPRAETAFERMSFTHRKGYARWISEVKRDETMQRRVQQALEMFTAGKYRS